MRWLSSNPPKRRTELLLLAYSPLWMAIIGAVMASTSFAHWSESQHEALGVGLALPIWVIALDPSTRPHAARFALLLTLFAFLQCYFGSWLFFDAFGMQYHFNVRVIVNGTPLFLYFLTVAYFATYYTVLQIGWRAVRTRWPRSPVLHLLARAGLSYLVAFGETASMATESMKKWFSYAEPRWVMTWGSLCYGTVFFVSLPIFYDLDEDPQAPPRPMRQLVIELLAANMVVLVAYVVYGWLIMRRP